MLETMAAFTLAEHMGGLTFANSPVKAGYARLLGGGRRPARTRDGWIALLPYTAKHWEAFFHAAGQDALCARYDVADRQSRNRNIQALYGHLLDILRERGTDEWLAMCDELDIPATRIYGLDELPEHPHLKAVGLFRDSVHPTEGRVRELRPTTRFHGTPTSIRRPAPTLGQHTEEVLAELRSRNTP